MLADFANRLSKNLSAKLTFAYLSFLGIWMLIPYVLLVQHGFFSWDYFKYYQCGAMALSADRFNVYDSTVQMHWYNRIIAPLRVDVDAYNQYVPPCFVLMIPLAVLPVQGGFWVWTISTLLFGLSGVYFLMRELALPAPGKRTLALSIWALSSYPAFNWFQLGQSSWLLIGFISYSFSALISRRDILAGVMLALAAIKPQYAFYTALPALSCKRFRPLIFAALAETILLVAAALVIGVKNVVGYPKILIAAESTTNVFGVFQESMVCVRAVISRIVPPEHMTQVVGVFAILGALLLFYQTFMVGRKNTPFPWRWAITASILSTLVFSPHVHIYDAQLLAISAAITLRLEQPPEKGTLYTIWCALMFAYPILSWAAFLSLNIPGGNVQNHPLLMLVLHSILLAMAFCFLNTDKSATEATSTESDENPNQNM